MEFERDIRPPNSTRPRRATVYLEDGEYLCVKFRDARGKEHEFGILAQPYVMNVQDLESKACMTVGGSTGVILVPPAPKEQMGA